jgi:hypothetical protein
LPEALSSRQQDGAEPLLAIADLAGGDWPERSRAALIEILTGEEASDQSIGVQLLDSIRTVFQEAKAETLSTADLIGKLIGNENWPWSSAIAVANH